jgi:hypothetical protein
MTNPTTKAKNPWIEQCDAAERIRDAFGLEKALEYIIGEKCFSFVSIAERAPGFARELPQIANTIRRIFTKSQIRDYLKRLKRTKYRRPWVSDAELNRFERICKLLA